MATEEGEDIEKMLEDIIQSPECSTKRKVEVERSGVHRSLYPLIKRKR
jgi:hypothetical protein